MSRLLSSILLPLALGLSLAFPALGPALGQTMGGGTVGVRGLTTDAVLEQHLKAVDSAADEECLTYEDTVGDFEWQSCISGAVTSVIGTAPIASSGGITPAISITADGIDFTEIADDMTLDGNLMIEVPAAENITIDSRTAPSTHTQGIMRYEHTAAAVNTRVIELEVDAASFASTHAVRADLHATALAPGEVMIGYHVSADTSTSTGGMIEAVRVDKAGAGTAEVHALHIDPGVDVIHQESGTFGALESAWENAVEVTSELNDTGTDLTLFSSNSDILYIGDAAAFNALEVNLDTVAGGAGIKPTFEFSNDGGGGWDTFTPVDGTDGFRETAIIEWAIADLTNWQTDTVNGVANKFWIRITRTQPSIPQDPIEDTIQGSKTVERGWDEDGDIDVRQILASGTANLQDNILQRANLLDYGEITNAIGDTGGGAQDIDLELGNVVTATQTVAQTTYTFSNPTASDEGFSFTLIIKNGASNGGTVFPGSVTFVTDGGVTPTLQTSGTDILSFITTDGGTIWYGYGPVTGTRSLWIPALEWTPTVTDGATALASTETTATRPDIKHLGFAAAADDFAQAAVAFPTAWDNGTVTFKAYWAHAGGSTFTIDLGLQCVTVTDGETMDVAYGTAVIVEDTGGTGEDLYITPESAAITCGGTPADGELTEFQIYRDVSGDDLDVDLDLIGVKILYTVDANT